MVRVIYFQQNIGFGACERYFLRLAQDLDKSRYDVCLLHPDHPTFKPFRQLDEHGVRIQTYSLNLLNGNAFVSIFKLAYLFRTLNPSMIHFNDPCVHGMIAAIIARVPVVVMTHHTPEMDRLYNWKGKLLEWFAFRSSPHIVFTSEYDLVTGSERDHIAPKRCSVIPLGIDMDLFAVDRDSFALREELGILPTDLVIGNVARLVPQKGHCYMIEAAMQVIQCHSNVTFVVVGEGILLHELVEFVESKGCTDRFVFLGWRDDVPNLLGSFDVFVNPSIYEGLCLAVVEAAAMACPIVSTAVGGVPAVIQDGRSGKLVQPLDPSELANALIWMVEHPVEAKEMGRQAKLSVIRKYSNDNMTRQSYSLYDRLLSDYFV